MLKERVLGYAVVFLLLALVASVGTAVTYKTLYDNTSYTLGNLQESVKNQNAEAADKLARMTADRDAKQKLLDSQALEQENKDALALAEIDRLTGELVSRPFRVRYVPAPSGPGSGGAAGDPATTSPAGAEDTETRTGLLPEANRRRLASALKEVEMLSAAYNSCRDTLMPTGIAQINGPQGAFFSF